MRTFALSAADVSASVRASLVAYLPARLADSPRPLPAPTSYEEVPTQDVIKRVFGSTLAVVTPGLRGKERRAENDYDLTWGVVVVVWHQQTPALPLLTAGGDYNAAVRQVFIDHCPAIAEDIEYQTESWDYVGDGLSDLTVGMSMCEFTVRTGSTALYTPPGPDTSGPVVQATSVTTSPRTS